MRRRKVQELSPQILDAASEWFIEFNEGTVDSAAREEFVRWLRVSPEHVRAYLQISAHWEDARALDSTCHKATVDELIALGRTENQIVPLRHEDRSIMPTVEGIRAVGTSGRSRAHSRYRLIAFAASALLAVSLSWFYSQRNVYATGIGEHRYIKLGDGSSIDLNSRSRIRVSFDGRQRNIELIEGQALFNVAKDKDRPFVVRANQARVVAIGTQFDVYKKSSGTIVTVVEGKVAITSALGSAATAALPEPAMVSNPATGGNGEIIRPVPEKILVSAGEQITVTASDTATPTPADVVAATAWTQKQLIFRATALTDVVEEFNRYNNRPMIITDPQLGALRISGVFSSTDPDSLLRALDAQGNFIISETSDAIEIAAN